MISQSGSDAAAASDAAASDAAGFEDWISGTLRAGRASEQPRAHAQK